MGKGIKIREVVQSIKVHDSAVNVGDRIKNIGVKSKEAVSEKQFHLNSMLLIKYRMQ